VQTALDGLKASKPAVVWDLLIAGQQEAINELVHQFATEMDPEVWDATVRTLKKLAGVFETKKDTVLHSSLWSVAGVKADDLKAGWDPAVQLLNSILKSELVDLERMKQFDGRALLQTAGPILCAQTHALLRVLKVDQLQKLEESKVSTRKSDDSSARVVLQPSDPKAKPIDLELSYEHGRWISTQLSMVVAYLLNKKLPAYHKLFKPYFLADWKDAYLADLKRVEKALDQLEAAKTPADFDAVVVREIVPVALQRVAQFKKGVPTYKGLKAVSYLRKATTAMVLIKGKHTAGDPDLKQLMAQLDQSDALPAGIGAPRIVEGTAVILVDPVSDLGALVRTVEKGKIGKIVQIDVKRKTLTIELATPAGGDRGVVAEKPSAKSRPNGK
jgi:hypothetical protein